MAYREHQGWTPANHLVELRAQQAYREHEAAHLAAVRGTLTTARAPLNDGHLRRNAKREIAREVEHAQVEHANLLLLAKLHRTVNRPSSAGPSGLGSAHDAASCARRSRARPATPSRARQSSHPPGNTHGRASPRSRWSRRGP